MSTPIFTKNNDGSREFNRYCRNHSGTVADPKDHEHRGFFDYINNSRDKYFDSRLELYTGVQLHDMLYTRGFVDFAQEGLVAKLHINSPKSKRETVRRERKRKNKKLRLAQAFFEEITKMPFRAMRIDRIYENGLWRVRTVDVTNPASSYSKL